MAKIQQRRTNRNAIKKLQERKKKREKTGRGIGGNQRGRREHSSPPQNRPPWGHRPRPSPTLEQAGETRRGASRRTNLKSRQDSAWLESANRIYSAQAPRKHGNYPLKLSGENLPPPLPPAENRLCLGVVVSYDATDGRTGVPDEYHRAPRPKNSRDAEKHFFLSLLTKLHI